MDHPHHHHHHQEPGGTLRNAFILTVVVLLVEVGTGLRANSLALLADAGHILTDAFSLALAWFAGRYALRAPDEQNTFGYRRSPILAALANGALLIVIAVVVTMQAIARMGKPPEVHGAILVPAALFAIAVNLFIAFGLRDERHHNLNVRAAFLHVIGDIAASVAVVVAGIAILLWHAYALDPILSVAVAVLIAVGAWRLVRETLGILMEGTPAGVTLDEVREAMMQVPGVLDVHDLHVWALSDGFRLLTAHVVVPEQTLADVAHLIRDVKVTLRRRFHIEHATIEAECPGSAASRRRPVTFHDAPGRETG